MNPKLRISIFVLSILCVLGFAWLDIDQPSPGPLSPMHATLSALQGADGCVLCHGDAPSKLAPSCLECHQKVSEQINRTLGIHGELSNPEQAQCGLCHPEHLEAEPGLLLNFSFEQAGLLPPDQFQHGTIDFRLDGSHSGLLCVDCHSNADADILQEGNLRFLQETQDCTSCHDDPHQGAMQRGCADCHGQEHAFDNLDFFPHDIRIPLHDSHDNLDCSACHEENGSYSVVTLSDRTNTLPWRTCSGCHQTPHSPSFISRLPLPPAAEMTSMDRCVLCHSETHADFFGPDVVWEDQWHRASGFALDSPHANLECSSCHGERQSYDDFDLRYPGRPADQCASCHEDPHRGQFDHAPFQENGCLSCHQSDTFQSHEFSVEYHNQTSYPLVDRHAETECAACHKLQQVDDPSSRLFSPTNSKCHDCHQDVHQDSFHPSEEDACARCHQPTDFRDLTSKFDHDKETGFALTLGHAELACAECHQRTPFPDVNGRTLGKVSELHPGSAEACAGCHQDPHEGSFDLPGMASQVDGRLGCARCHSTDSFTTLRANNFDHGLWTSMDLTGAHRQAECVTCHGSTESSTRLGKVTDHFPGDPTRCATCHQDPHQGDFDQPNFKPMVLGRVGCARCHQSTSFRQVSGSTFEHGYWTGFPLRGAHQLTECIQCHSPIHPPLANGRSMARAVGSECSNCHLDTHAGQFLQNGKQDCRQCHQAETRSFLLPDFDHTEQTNFALDQTHERLACLACHMAASTSEGESVVRYRPLGHACSDCHLANTSKSIR